MTTQSPRADRIIREASKHAAQYTGPDALCQEIGFLRGGIHGLAAMVDQYTNVGVKPESGCVFVADYLCDADVLLEIDYERGERQTYDHPGCEPTATLCTVYICGVQVDRKAFSDEQIAKWEAAAFLKLAEADEDTRDDDADRARDRQLEEAEL